MASLRKLAGWWRISELKVNRPLAEQLAHLFFIGRMPLKSFPVDHSVFGATAFAVRTSQGWVVYKGTPRAPRVAAAHQGHPDYILIQAIWKASRL